MYLAKHKYTRYLNLSIKYRFNFVIISTRLMIKILLITSILSLATAGTQAQITSIAMNVEDLKDAPFKYRGTRALMVDRIDDASSKHIFVFSKPASGSSPDTLFAQKYTKQQDTWRLVQEKVIVANGAISIWKSRKAFLDADKDKQVDALFIYSLHDASMKQQLSVHLLLMYKGESYIISEEENKKTSYSANFSSLPETVRKQVIDYWKTLDKN